MKNYHIRTTENVRKTLNNLIGVPFLIWKKYNRLENKYEILDELVEEVIHSYGHIPQSYKDFDFIFSILLLVQKKRNIGKILEFHSGQLD